MLRNCLLKHFTEGKIEGSVYMTVRRGRRRKQPLDDLKETRGYWILIEEALDRTHWRTRFRRSYGRDVRQTRVIDRTWRAQLSRGSLRARRSRRYFPARRKLANFTFCYFPVNSASTAYAASWRDCGLDGRVTSAAIPHSGKRFFFLRNVWTGFGAHPSLLFSGNRPLFLWGKAAGASSWSLTTVYYRG